MRKLSLLVGANIVFSIACFALIFFSMVSSKAVFKLNEVSIEYTERQLPDSSLYIDTLNADTVVNWDTLIVYTYHKNGMSALVDYRRYHEDYKSKGFRFFNDSKGVVRAVQTESTFVWRCIAQNDLKLTEKIMELNKTLANTNIFEMIEYSSDFGSGTRITKNPFACIQ